MPGTVLWLRWGHDSFADDETRLGQLCCNNMAMTALAIADNGTCLGQSCGDDVIMTALQMMKHAWES